MSIDILGSASRQPSIIWRALTSVAKRVQAYNVKMQHRSRLRADRKILMSKPDHMLKDIGVNRSEIDIVLYYEREIDKVRANGFMPR